MVTRRPITSFRGQRQQTFRLVYALHVPGTNVLGARGGSEGDRLVATPARPARVRRRHGRPMHTVLEHSHLPAHAVCRYRIPSMQPCMVEALQRAGVHARLLSEPDISMEVSVIDAGGETNRSLIPRPVLSTIPRRRGDSHRRRRRDAAVLERFLQDTLTQGEQERSQPIHST